MSVFSSPYFMSDYILTRHWCGDPWSQLPLVSHWAGCDLRRLHNRLWMCGSPRPLTALASSSQRDGCGDPSQPLPRSSCLDAESPRRSQGWWAGMFVEAMENIRCGKMSMAKVYLWSQREKRNKRNTQIKLTSFLPKEWKHAEVPSLPSSTSCPFPPYRYFDTMTWLISYKHT